MAGIVKFVLTTNINPIKAAKKFRRDKRVSELERLANAEILVGFPQGATNTDPDTGETVSVAEYARKNNYGTMVKFHGKEVPVPARPFFTEGFYFDKYQEKRIQLAKNIARQVVQGKISAEEGAGLIGVQAVNDVRDSIQTGPWVENSPYTKAKKLKRSRGKKAGSVKPLIDTGTMIGAVTYIVNMENTDSGKESK